MVIRMKREKEELDLDRIRELRQEAAQALVRYLDTFHPEGERTGSKHALMGPVGKLLTRVTSTGDINWEAVKGYVLSVHKNQQTGRGVSAEAAERLDAAVDLLAQLRALLPPTKWLKTVEDLDDEVFFLVYKQRLVGQRKGIQKAFQEWLKTKYASIEDLNDLFGPDEGYTSFEDVEDPFSVPEELAEVAKEFWEYWKEHKKKE